MKVFIVTRQTINNAFIWAVFSTQEAAHSFIDEQEERGFDGFYIKELILDEG